MQILEIQPTNNFYDHSELIKNYCLFPKFLPLPVSIQHGWYSPENPFEKAEVEKDPTEVWVWSKNAQNIGQRDYPDFKFRIIGSPILYLINKKEKKATKKFLVFWPRVDWFSFEDEINYVSQIKILCGSGDLTIRVHGDNEIPFLPKEWKQYVTRKCHKKDYFYAKLIDQISEHETCVFFTSTTAIFYAAYYDRKIIMDFSYLKKTFNNHFDKHRTDLVVNHLEKIENLDEISLKQMSENELGVEYKISKMKMALLLVANCITINYLGKLMAIIRKKFIPGLKQ